MTRASGLAAAKPVPEQKGSALGRFVRRHLAGESILFMVALFSAVILWPYVVVTVPSGHVGVLWYRLIGFDPSCWCFLGRGTALDPRDLKEEGLHLIAPWNKLFIYDLRLQSTTLTVNGISKDGVSVTAQINVRYQLLHHSIGVLHKFIGPDYVNSVIIPEIGSQAREVISKYTSQEVYTSRDKIQEEIKINTQKGLGANLNKLVQPESMEQPDPKHYNDFLQSSIQILDTPILSIELPPSIVAAINRQTQEFYQIQEYKYRVQREAEESQRKLIEANGIAAFQKRVSQGISDSYLRWRGIEATLALAKSRNAKIVVIGSGKDGLPIILGNVDASMPSAGASQSSPPGTKLRPRNSPVANASSPIEGQGYTKQTSGAMGVTPSSAMHQASTPGSLVAPSGSGGGQGFSGRFEPFDVKSIISRIYGTAAPGNPTPEESKKPNSRP
jgi:regulator of protease activity HflC (stomatin/prohibitin superfamily)